MRGAVLAAPGTISMRDMSRPVPGPGQVLFRLEGCGVCGSNLPLWQGRDWFQYPRPAGEPGHEGWGIVEEVGDGVHALKPGDRIAALSFNSFAEYDVADASAVVRLPEWLNGKPFPGEPLGCAMNVFRRADLREGQTVAVVGVGFLGALLVQLAVSAGARVIALSHRVCSLEVAHEQGAEHVIRMADSRKVVDRVEQLTDGRLCDRVIEATGLQGPLDLAAAVTRERGRLVIAGYHQDGPRTVDMQLWNWRGLDVINAHERDTGVYVRGIEEAVDAIADGRMDPFPLFTHMMGLDALEEALHLLDTRPDGFLKALVLTNE